MKALVCFLVLVISAHAYPPIGDPGQPAEVRMIPLAQAKSWQDFGPQELPNLRAAKGMLQLTDRYPFDSELALRWDYAPGDVLTFWKPVEKASSFLWYVAFLDESPEPPPFRVEVVDGAGEAAVTFGFQASRRWWQTAHVRGVTWAAGLSHLNISNPEGTVPAALQEVRIHAPAQSGTLYLGKYVVVANFKEGPGRVPEMVRLDSPAAAIPDAKVPAVKPVSEVQRESLRTIAQRVARAMGLDRAPAAGTKLTDEEMGKIRKSFAGFAIRRTRHGLAANNPTIHPANAQGYRSRERDFAMFMNDLSQAYHRIDDKAERAEIWRLYLLLFDYHWYSGGMPDSWAGSGEGFVPSVFRMRHLLKQAGRLTPAVVANMRRRLGFDRVYLDYSLYCKSWRGRPYREGELGEDTDFFRMRVREFPALILLDPDERVQTRDIQALSRWLSQVVFHYSPGVIDGFKPDGSINHHWGFIEGYGIGVMEDAPALVHLLSRTQFRLSQRAHQFVRDAVAKHDFYSKHNIHPVILSGKGFNPKRYGGPYTARFDRFALLALAGPAAGKQPVDDDMLGRYLRSLRHFEATTDQKPPTSPHLREEMLAWATKRSIPPAPELWGHRTLGWAAADIHRRGDWMVVVKGHSQYQYEAESFNFSTFLGYGTTYVFRDAWVRYRSPHLEYDLGEPGWDWRHMPGTTSVLWPWDRVLKKDYKRYRSDQSFVGGVALDGQGVFALSLHGSQKQGLDSFRARKSWFSFDDTIVCVGSHIGNQIGDAATVTTISQDFLAKPDETTIFDGRPAAELDRTWELADAKPTWFLDGRGAGYYVPAGQRLRLRRAWQIAPDAENKKQTKGCYATAWLDHGMSPDGARYMYALRPSADAPQMGQFAQAMDSTEPPFRLLPSPESVHAVASREVGMVGAVLWEPASGIKLGPLQAADTPCTVLLKRTGQGWTLAIADPDLRLIDSGPGTSDNDWGYSQPSRIRLRLAAGFTIDGKPQSEVEVTCRDGLPTILHLRAVP